MTFKIYIGSDPREGDAYQVCEKSIRAHTKRSIDISPIRLDELRAAGLYTRKHEHRDGQLFDVISDAPMSTEFAISRFMVPALCRYKGWALFCDCDFMFRADIGELFSLADDKYAVMCVKHHYIQKGGVKMDRQAQTVYNRKNWSSLVLWNCAHPSNSWLTPEEVNRQTGKFLHKFRWLQPHEIGAIPFEWNWLDLEPKAVHYTDGIPSMGYKDHPYAGEWFKWLTDAD